SDLIRRKRLLATCTMFQPEHGAMIFEVDVNPAIVDGHGLATVKVRARKEQIELFETRLVLAFTRVDGRRVELVERLLQPGFVFAFAIKKRLVLVERLVEATHQPADVSALAPKPGGSAEFAFIAQRISQQHSVDTTGRGAAQDI